MAASSTVIAALRYRAGALIAADSQASDMAAYVRWSVPKLRQVANHPFVIGCSGSMGSADRMMDTLAQTPIVWTDLTERVRLQNILDGLFQPEYAAAQQRSHAPLGVPGIDIAGLAAVYVANEPRLLELETNGESCWHEFFHAIGSGSRTAYAIYRTLGGRELSKLGYGTALNTLLRIIRTAISVEMWGVAEPIVVWNVSADGARQVGADELNAQLQAVDEWEKSERERLFAADASA